MTRILLIRHGETLWNKNLQCLGHTDISLSEEGIRQAKLLAQRLAGEQIHAVYSSDLSRAYETAQIIAKPHNLPVQTIPALRELNFGEWEGYTYAEVEQRDGKRLQEWWRDVKNCRVPGGETFAELEERAMKILKEIASRHDGQTVAAVTHGGTIKTILCSVVGADLCNNWRFKQDNAALNILEFYPEGAIICCMNDTGHLRGG